MRQTIARALVPVLWVTLLLAGCLKPPITGRSVATDPTIHPAAATAVAPPLVGQVEHYLYRVQGSTITDIASGSTVSIIDTTTNQTLNTTVTDGNGSFVIRFTPGFQPSNNLYYLEAYKGLPVDGAPNRAGISMARVRTLIRFESNRWRHLYPTEGIKISLSSTALSIVTSLRSASSTTRVDPATLLDSLSSGVSGDTFSPGSSGVSASEFATVRGLVVKCLDGNQDPLYRITYDIGSQAYFLVDKGIEISSVLPLSGPMGSTVTIQGSNLGTAPIVRFNGVVAACTVNGVSSVITATVPRGATSGPVTVQVGDIVFNGASFAVSPWDGHNVFDAANNMYVSSSNDNRIYRFDPNGNASLYVADGLLNYPRGLVVDPQGNVYVANWNANNILKVDTSQNVSIYASGGGLNRPVGLALGGNGDLYVANYNGNNILTVASGSATPTVFATSSEFQNPFGLAFDSQGNLYASSWSGGNVAKIAPDGTVTSFASGLSNPGTLAFDSSDNLYVPCYGTHNVFKLTPQGGFSVFTSLPNYPGWAAMNPDGTLYVGSYSYDFIAKVDPQARVLGYYSSGHLTWSIKANPANNDLYVTSGYGWGYRTQTVYRMAYDGSAPQYGYYRPPTPVIKDLPNPSAIDYVDPSTMYVGDWGGLIHRANPGNGSYVTYAANLGAISDLAHDNAGNLYAAGWSDHSIYHFAGNALVKRFATAWSFSSAAFGPDGYMYVPDNWRGKILRVSPDGVLTTYSDRGGLGFASPHGLTFDTAGNLYVASWGNDRIYKVATGSLDVTDYATGMSDPNGMAFDAAGNLFVSNYGDSTVKKVLPGGGTGSVSNFATGLGNPRGLDIDRSTGTLYTANWNGTVHQITSAGAVSTYASGLGSCMQVFRDTDGSLLVTSYGNRTIYVIPPGGGNPVDSYGLSIRPGGALKDAAGNLYALTWDAPNIYRFDTAARRFRLWGATVRTPAGVTLDPSQTNLYVADWDNYVIQKINLTTGGISVVANSMDWSGGPDELKGITFGPDGKLYVAGWGNGTWQLDLSQANPNNGNGAVRYGNNTSSNGILGGIAFGANGNLYGTTWDWTYYGSAPVTVIPPGATSGGGGNATSLRNFPNRIGF